MPRIKSNNKDIWAGPSVYTIIKVKTKEILLSDASRNEYNIWLQENKHKYEESRREVAESSYLTHVTIYVREKK